MSTEACESIEARCQAASLIYEAPMVQHDDWLFEIQPPGTYAFEEDRLLIEAPYKNTGATAWIRRAFPANLIIEYKAVLREPDGGRNLNLFFCASQADGSPMEPSERTGQYKEYHQFPNYIMTFTSNYTRMRRDPGFEELSTDESWKAQIGQPYTIHVSKVDGKIQCFINGTMVHDNTDPASHGEGWLGLRTWYSNTTYENLRVYTP